MNIIREIETIKNQVDFLIWFLTKKDNSMLDLATLEAEFAKVKALFENSKSVITSLKATIAAHEATIANNVAAFVASNTVDNAVSGLVSDISSASKDFESFLSLTPANVVYAVANGVIGAATVVVEAAANVASGEASTVITNAANTVISNVTATVDNAANTVTSPGFIQSVENDVHAVVNEVEHVGETVVTDAEDILKGEPVKIGPMTV